MVTQGLSPDVKTLLTTQCAKQNFKGLYHRCNQVCCLEF